MVARGVRTPLVEWMESFLGPAHRAGSENVLFKCPFHEGGKHGGLSFTMHVYSGLCGCKSCGKGWTLFQLLSALGVGRDVYTAMLASGVVTKTERVRGAQMAEDPKMLPEEVLFLLPHFSGALPGDEDNPEYEPFPDHVLREFDVRLDESRKRVVYPVRDDQCRLRALHYRNLDPNSGRYMYYSREDLAEMGVDYDPAGKEGCFLHGECVLPAVWRSETAWIVLTEGPKQSMRVFQADIPWVIGALGDMGAQQVETLARYNARVLILTDNDPPGRAAAKKYWTLLMKKGVKAEILDYGSSPKRQPDAMKVQEIRCLVTPYIGG